jgi:hypothetical protein
MSIDSKEIPPPEWYDYLETFSKDHEGDAVTIEVLSADFGDELEAERLPLKYVEYDYKDDVVIVAVGGRDGRYPVVLRHMVQHPQRILADTEIADGRWALDVVGQDDSETIVAC